MKVPSFYTYYAYGTTIARVNYESQELEIKQHSTDQWQRNSNATAWKRIQEEGSLIEDAAQAEKIYGIFHAKFINSTCSLK